MDACLARLLSENCCGMSLTISGGAGNPETFAFFEALQRKLAQIVHVTTTYFRSPPAALSLKIPQREKGDGMGGGRNGRFGGTHTWPKSWKIQLFSTKNAKSGHPNNGHSDHHPIPSPFEAH